MLYKFRSFLLCFFLLFAAVSGCKKNPSISPAVEPSGPLVYRLWTQASPPVGMHFEDKESLYWFNPLNIQITDIWPELQDLSNQKYIVLWIKPPRSMKGRIHIDVGEISEDVLPSYVYFDDNGDFDSFRTEPTWGTMNREDKEINGIRHGIFQDHEDVGLDELPDSLEERYREEFPGSGFPAPYYDNWQPATVDLTHFNGTEGNKYADDIQLPDTEDINGDGILNTQNHYFSYSFSFDENSADSSYIADRTFFESGRPTGWRLYRIPLNRYDKQIGSPLLSQVQFIRIWFDEFDFTLHGHRIMIASFDVPGEE